jgi:hypothetical protein
MPAPPRPEPAFPGYDEATLRAARGDSFLLVDAGLAVAAQWVACAAPGLRLALPTPASADEDTARYYRHYGLPGHRAAMRALLDDAQAYADRAPERAPSDLELAGEAEGGEVAWLVGAGGWLRVGLAPAHLHLVGEGDRLLAVRHHRATQVVVRAGRVAAVIRGRALVGGRAADLDALPRG